MRKEIYFGSGMLLTLFLLGVVSGAGVAYPAWEGNPALVYPGDEGYLSLGLQNMVGEEDLVFRIEVGESEIDAEMDEDEYLVPAGRDDVGARLYYEIPEDAQPGDSYVVFVSTVTYSPGLTGGIESGVGFDSNIPFLVREEPPAPSPEVESGGYAGFLVFLGIIVVVAGIVVYFVMRKKK